MFVNRQQGRSPRPGQEPPLNLGALRELRGMDRFFILLVPIAIAAAIFHFASGRIGNGIMAIGAVIVGLIVVTIRASAMQNEADVAPVDEDDDWFGWDEDADPADELDRPTDEPLPAPFQTVFDEILSRGIPGGDDDSHIRQPH
jgi:hypothetical protein